MYVLNFYSPVFVDQLKRGRKTATIRLGDKSMKYRRGQLVWITVGYRSGSIKNHDFEVESVEWVPLAEAPKKLSYRGEREMAELALSRGLEGR